MLSERERTIQFNKRPIKASWIELVRFGWKGSNLKRDHSETDCYWNGLVGKGVAFLPDLLGSSSRSQLRYQLQGMECGPHWHCFPNIIALRKWSVSSDSLKERQRVCPFKGSRLSPELLNQWISQRVRGSRLWPELLNHWISQSIFPPMVWGRPRLLVCLDWTHFRGVDETFGLVWARAFVEGTSNRCKTFFIVLQNLTWKPADLRLILGLNKDFLSKVRA